MHTPEYVGIAYMIAQEISDILYSWYVAGASKRMISDRRHSHICAPFRGWHLVVS